ncbi:MAG: type I-D CRISPR-associated protein Cas10d/Csc3, partial [Tolypothrix sp. T3-bin4]|nr:type I-D CRISPR-associated protein Cas10d/Csc3 [Tolypothrix sp. T3-bin4]
INESLKEHKLKGNTGGVPYEWYYLAAKYLEHNPGIEDVRPICHEAIVNIAHRINPIIEQYKLPDGWDDLRLWVTRVVMLPGKATSATASAEVFLQELSGYQLAKKQGRGRQLICSISHSPYTVTEQMESAVLFTPQVYTNKQMLGGSNAKRNISSIAGIEMMLRQILMNQTQAVGKKFEDGKYRYLYFYPTYYFTPETNKFLQKAYSGIAQTRFDTSIRNHFISKDLEANLERERYQSVDAFLIDENIEPGKDRTFKLSYPEDQPLTFYFMALPPGRDGTDTESWVMPTWLAFAFPMILDIKTVVSESPIPPFNDGAEFEESVFLDSAPQAFRVLTKRDRFRLDYILEGWTEDSKEYSAPLNVLTAAYAIHLDVNARQGKSGYDSNWGRFTELAKDFETSPLYVFSYLNKWVRNQGVETARIEKIKLYAYHFYPCFDPYAKFNSELEEMIMGDESQLNHPKKLTELYRKFYRANKRYNPKANAVLKPIDIASKTILEADLSFQGEVMVDMVAAEVFKLMDRVHSSTAEGRWMFKNREEERQAILEFAQ